MTGVNALLATLDPGTSKPLWLGTVTAVGIGDLQVLLDGAQRSVTAKGNGTIGARVIVTAIDRTLYVLANGIGGSSVSLTAFREDSATATVAGAAVVVALQYAPKTDSIHVYKNVIFQPTSEWSLSGLSLTLSADAHTHVGDLVVVKYAYEITTAALTGPVIVTPLDGSSITDSTPTISGTAASARAIEIFVDGVSVGTTTSSGGGAWTVTVGSPLSNGTHTITVNQTEPDARILSATPTTFVLNRTLLIPAMLALGPLWMGMLDESSGTVMTDSSGYANNGAYHGGVTLGHASIMAGLTGTCPDFNGSSGYGEVPYNSRYDTPTIGLVAWITDDTPTAIGSVIDRDNLGAARCWQFRINASGKVEFIFWTTTGGPYFVTGATTVTAGSMVAATFDGTTAKVYLNGVVDASLTQSGTLQSGTGLNVIDVGVSRSGAFGAFAAYFDGRIQAAAVYTSLSATDISNIYGAGTTP